ncbi:MAG TPA: selenocysteine-specific translation elongation factor [Gaiellaceae bacterium]|jgi:selenocysteine-specific elongation factor
MPLTVGTAGHIDHGKTWLVRALTGKDTDRLPEEQERGISIDLGYAPLDLPDGRRLSLIDVPGHERFVRNMVAGATGIDLFLLVVDAGEGARPQTREHLAILSLLGIDRGVVAVTKADAVDEETLELAVEEARELVPGAEVVAVSAKTGAGLDDLRAAVGRAADLVEQEDKADSAARLFVDRVFSLRGIGTVVTGTLWSGSIGEGDILRAEPGGREVRVRSVQVHERPVARAEAGQRVALALPGVERSDLRRGDALVAPGAFAPSYRLDVVLDELEPIADGARLHVHHGTGSAPARVVRVGERYAQLRLSAPVVAARGDRVVLRGETTVGGALVLDPSPARHADADRFAQAERGEAPVYAPSLRDGRWEFATEWVEELRAALERDLEAADPLDPGVPAPTEPWAKDVLPLLPFERRGSRLYLPGASGSLGAREGEAQALEAALAEAEPGAVKVEDAELARFLERDGRLIRLGDGWAVSAAAYERTRTLVVEECESAGEIALARFRDLAGCGRRDAQLLLERLDADGVTRRLGDRRVLRRRSPERA